MKLKITVLVVFLTWSVTLLADQAAPERLVLIVGAKSPLVAIDPREVRYLFLGLPVTRNSIRIQPLINRSDNLLYEAFLQKVIYMSAQIYERRLISRTFRTGQPRLPVYRDQRRLFDRLRAEPNTVSYAWSSALTRHDDLRIIGTLWEGAIQ